MRIRLSHVAASRAAHAVGGVLRDTAREARSRNGPGCEPPGRWSLRRRRESHLIYRDAEAGRESACRAVAAVSAEPR